MVLTSLLRRLKLYSLIVSELRPVASLLFNRDTLLTTSNISGRFVHSNVNIHLTSCLAVDDILFDLFQNSLKDFCFKKTEKKKKRLYKKRF